MLHLVIFTTFQDVSEDNLLSIQSNLRRLRTLVFLTLPSGHQGAQKPLHSGAVYQHHRGHVLSRMYSITVQGNSKLPPFSSNPHVSSPVTSPSQRPFRPTTDRPTIHTYPAYQSLACRELYRERSLEAVYTKTARDFCRWRVT